MVGGRIPTLQKSSESSIGGGKPMRCVSYVVERESRPQTPPAAGKSNKKETDACGMSMTSDPSSEIDSPTRRQSAGTDEDSWGGVSLDD